MTKTTDKATQPTKVGVSYLRVSTKEQAAKGGQNEGFSIPAQREANRRKAASMGAVIIEEFVDAGESARSADRPDLQRMLQYLATHPVDFVFVHKVDRLARNRLDDVEITLAIRRSGAMLVSASENIDETPSGMLLHGIMSSIAEYHSLNLATEVLKGMGEKAKLGGTPGRSPLGYRNIGRFTPEGREDRTVEIDPDRGPLIAWAFKAYATGDWTLRTLTDELELRGLTTRRTPKQPARAIPPNVLHQILTNPYYKGEVVYRGVRHPGRHEPLVDEPTWQQVQDVLAINLVGEKQREHRHYLKSSIFCGVCGSRLIITNAKNRYGVVYPYYVCIGRQMKRTPCRFKAILIAKVEKLIEDHWATVQLDPALRTDIEAALKAELADRTKEAQQAQHQLERKRANLLAQRQKLLDAIYAGAVPLDMIATEQDRISTQLTTIEQRLSATKTEIHSIEANLTRALDLAQDCHYAYLTASPHVRRLFNQAFFTHLYIDEEGIHAELAEPFDVLLEATDSPTQAETRRNPSVATDQRSNPPTANDSPQANAWDTALQSLLSGENHQKTPGIVPGVGGLRETTLARQMVFIPNF